MTTLALTSLSKSPIRSPLRAGMQGTYADKRRWLHQSQSRQAILMPAMSPYMMDGTIARWKKKEGEAFNTGDVLLQIESDIAMVDVEAQSPGILGRILVPDGTTNVPVEQVIALVAKDARELADLTIPSDLRSPTTPTLRAVTSPTRRSLPSPLYSEHSAPSFAPSARRSQSLFETQTVTSPYHHIGARGMATGYHARGSASKLTIIPPSPRTTIQIASPISSTTPRALQPRSAPIREIVDGIPNQLDGISLRRMIVSNLVRTPASATFTPHKAKCETAEYFDGLI